MSWRSETDRQEFFKRRSARYARLGRNMEDRVAGVLEQMVREGLLSRFVYHRPYSKADLGGRDFSVARVYDGGHEWRSFGITISSQRNAEVRNAHPAVPQFHFPLEIKDETIRSKVLKLFRDERSHAQ